MRFPCSQSMATLDSSVRIVRRSGMFGRVTILTLSFGLLSWSATSPAATTASPAKVRVLAAFPIGSTAECAVEGRPRGSSTLTRFTAWKARAKIVLAESHIPCADETDSGLASFQVGSLPLLRSLRALHIFRCSLRFAVEAAILVAIAGRAPYARRGCRGAWGDAGPRQLTACSRANSLTLRLRIA